jgi:hypothetical protein
MAGCVALVFNRWNLFVRLADPDHHREAITSRPLLLQAIGRQTNHAGRTNVTITASVKRPQRLSIPHLSIVVFGPQNRQRRAAPSAGALMSLQ